MSTTKHVAENIALEGSLLGKLDGTSSLGDVDHRFASLNIAGSGVIDYLTTIQFKKNTVVTLKIESDGRISGVVDPLYAQDVATRAYVLANVGGFDSTKILVSSVDGNVITALDGNVLLKL